MTFSQRLKNLRNASGITQAELASKLDITDAAVRAWELGRSKPRLDKLDELADILNTSKMYLLEGIQQATEWPEGALKPVGRSMRVPVRQLGTTHAGEAIEAIVDDTDTTVEVPAEVVMRHPKAFILHVVGECMNRRYPNGCVVLVDPMLEPKNGDAVVAALDGGSETILREYYRRSDVLVLSPDSYNDEYESIVFKSEFEEVHLTGVVVWFQAKEDVQR